MANSNPSEMTEEIRTWIEECFLSLEDRMRYQEITEIISQLERLQIPVSEDINSEKAALEKSLDASRGEESQLTSLAKELSSLAKDINHRLRDMRSRKTSKSTKALPKRLKVEFSDGTVICEDTATNTFVQSIQHIGLQRVSELPIRMNGCPLVSTRKPESARAARELEGYFIETHSNTEGKSKCIQQIAGALQIKVSVSVIHR